MTKICEGCGHRYKTYRSQQKYCCVAHMPTEVKRAAALKGRARGARTFRLKRFRHDLKRLPQKLTRDDLREASQRVKQAAVETTA